MKFSQTDIQNMAVDSIQRFAKQEILPIAESYKDKHIEKAKMHEILSSIEPFGLMNGPIPEDFGGYGLENTTTGLMYFELAKASPDIAIPCLIQLIAAKLLVISPPHIREKYLPGVLSGEKIASVAMSEPSVGSEVTAVSCRAKEDGDDLIINGEKTWICNGDYSDFTIALVRMNDHPVKGLALVVIDREDGYRSVDIPKMALNSQSTAQLFFDDIRIPKTNIVSPAGDALKTMLIQLQASRPIVAMMALGAAQAAIDHGLAYALDRKQFGKPIAGHQTIQNYFAESATKLKAAKLLALSALDSIDEGKRSDVDAAMAKWYGTEMAKEIIDSMVQVHGASGICSEYPVEYLYRAVRIYAFTEGTTEMQKLMIGRALTGIDALF